jgi:hypothetical protein
MIILAAIACWILVLAIVAGLCGAARGGDRELPEPAAPAPAPAREPGAARRRERTAESPALAGSAAG